MGWEDDPIVTPAASTSDWGNDPVVQKGDMSLWQKNWEALKGGVKSLAGGVLDTVETAVGGGLRNPEDDPDTQANVKAQVNQPLGIGKRVREDVGLMVGDPTVEQTPEKYQQLGGDVAQVGSLALPLGKAAGGRIARAFEKSPEDLIAKARPDVVKNHEVASRRAQLPMSDSSDKPADAHLESQLRSQAVQKHGALRDTQQIEGDAVFTKYFDAGAAKEAAPGGAFIEHESGIQLINDLKAIESGGTGKMTEFTQTQMTRAKRLREALSGVDPSDPTHKPVNLRVADQILREMRDDQYNTAPGGLGSSTRKQIGALADKLEGAIKTWVGPENYPRDAYAQLSAGLNKWDSKLGQKLTGRQPLEYVEQGDAPHTSQTGLSNTVFASRETVAEARTLLGDAEVNQMAEQRISNLLRNKSSEEAARWLDDPKNAWVQDIPGAKVKVARYIQTVAAREGNAKYLRWAKNILKVAGVGVVGRESWKAAGGG